MRGGPLPADRLKGLLWGAAIGDALGNTSESMRPQDRHKVNGGDVLDFLPNRHDDGRAVGLPSDDTQLTIWTMEALLECGQPDARALARAWRQAPLFGIGRTMRAWFAALDGLGTGDPWGARQHSAGNGALMRLPGAALPYLWTLDNGLYDSVVLSSALSHDDPTSTAACVAFAEILRRAVYGGPAAFPVGGFLSTYVAVAGPLEGQVQLCSRVPGSSFVGATWQLVESEVAPALRAGLAPLQAANSWYSGAFLLETVPTVLFLLEKYRDDPEEALVRAVNDTWDNDTVGSLVGAVMGALHGFAALPDRWRQGLLGRTSHHDDGRLDLAWRALRAYGGFGLRD
jgi:ADP-ribosylglycohydrolase